MTNVYYRIIDLNQRDLHTDGVPPPVPFDRSASTSPQTDIKILPILTFKYNYKMNGVDPQ